MIAASRPRDTALIQQINIPSKLWSRVFSRLTGQEGQNPIDVEEPDHTADPGAEQQPEPTKRRGPASAQSGPRTTSGRDKHDEKMTVYVTADELLDLEHARLALRRSVLSVDRGRLVREAIAIALADLDANGDDSVLVQRLTQA